MVESSVAVDQVLTTLRVVREVTRPPAVTALQRAIEDGSVGTTSIDMTLPAEQDALVRFDRVPAFRGRGDAEVLAVAVERGYLICSDDPAVRRSATAELGRGRVAGSLDILVWAVSEKRLSVQDAEQLFHRLDVAPGLESAMKKRGVSLAELLKN
jgi:predicted nucleic acid-binding protein